MRIIARLLGAEPTSHACRNARAIQRKSDPTRPLPAAARVTRLLGAAARASETQHALGLNASAIETPTRTRLKLHYVDSIRELDSVMTSTMSTALKRLNHDVYMAEM